MTKRQGATSENGFILKKIIQNHNVKEKKKSHSDPDLSSVR
jgi:hypothetical protein